MREVVIPFERNPIPPSFELSQAAGLCHTLLPFLLVARQFSCQHGIFYFQAFSLLSPPSRRFFISCKEETSLFLGFRSNSAFHTRQISFYSSLFSDFLVTSLLLIRSPTLLLTSICMVMDFPFLSVHIGIDLRFLALSLFPCCISYRRSTLPLPPMTTDRSFFFLETVASRQAFVVLSFPLFSHVCISSF